MIQRAPHRGPQRPDFDPRYFRDALGRFATGITVITACAPNGSLMGLTANSFNAVSLEPPLVLWSLASRAASLQVFQQISHYAINVLADDQTELSQRFAGAREHRFAGLNFREGAGGAPLLDGCLAWFECYNRSRYPEGDHVIFVGEVERCGFRDGEPLVFHAGKYRNLQQSDV